MINEQKEKWERGEISGDYNECRFTTDKSAYARKWLNSTKLDLRPDEPRNIVDRICHWKLEDIEHPNIPYIQLKSKWTDKIAVYDLLAEQGMSEISLPCECRTYAQNLDEEILTRLDGRPSEWKYIIKCNHGSGWNIQYTPGQTNHAMVMGKMDMWLQTNYAYLSGYEVQYKWIKPGYVIQPIYVHRPLDWSFWCEDGVIEGVGLTRKVGKNLEEYIAFVNPDGDESEWFIGSEPDQTFLNSRQKDILLQMKPYVEKIAKPFKFVRCDMYYMEGKVYFGEATFTPCSGILDITYKKGQKI